MWCASARSLSRASLARRLVINVAGRSNDVLCAYIALTRASMYKFGVVVPREALVARDEHIVSATIHVDAHVIKRTLKRDVRTQLICVAMQF